MADTLETIKCPACGTEMDKVFIPSEGINIDVCVNGCGGIFFDNKEFKSFDEKREDISAILDKLKNKNFKPVNPNEERICPVCKAKMVKNHSSVKRNIEVDECYTCGGKFLDNNELVKIREEYETEADRADAVIEEVYQTVGAELTELTKRHAKIKAQNKSILQKIFLKLMGIK